MIPQVIFVVWFFIEMLLQAYFHGKPKPNPIHNFWNDFSQWTMFTLLLIFGGFFDCWLGK